MKWVHRGCIGEDDDMMQPKQSRNGNCERCGMEGVLWLIVEGEEESVPTEEILPEITIHAVVEDEQGAIVAEVTTTADKIVEEVEDAVREQEEEEEVAVIAETIEDAVAKSVEVLTPENETVSEIEQLKARIAELEAREEAGE